ncbi:xanthine dehydrogenase/oxidase, partial [Plakobranchus ocellatus]
PVRLNLDLSTNMNNTNKRSPLLAKYKVGCDKNGKLVAIYIELYLDAGNQPMFEGELLAFIEGGYYSPNFTLKCRQVRTDKLFAGTVRAPGQVPSCLVIETVLEHLTKQAQQDPVMLREINLIEEGQHRLNGTPVKNCTMRKVWDRLKQTADVNTRQEDVDRFNKSNLWRKRGLSMTAVKYDMYYLPAGLPAHVSVFAADGTVTVITGGVEMGQGLYTKVRIDFISV